MHLIAKLPPGSKTPAAQYQLAQKGAGVPIGAHQLTMQNGKQQNVANNMIIIAHQNAGFAPHAKYRKARLFF